MSIINPDDSAKQDEYGSQTVSEDEEETDEEEGDLKLSFSGMLNLFTLQPFSSFSFFQFKRISENSDNTNIIVMGHMGIRWGTNGSVTQL